MTGFAPPPFTPPDGYAVGIGGIRLPLAQVNTESAEWALRHVGSEFNTSFVGTWVDEGWVHFDAVQYFGADRRPEAFVLGWRAMQKAIWSFADRRAFPVTFQEFDS